METKDRKRRFINNECNHIYQRTVNGFLIFYDREDYLVCYMRLSVIASKYNVTLLKICFMIDLIHLFIDAPSREIMSAFMRDYSSILIHEYNFSIGRSGQMFHKSYGIVYIGNNPVEKKLCIKIVKNASKSTAGSEHDIKEVFSSGSDQIYDEMVRYIKDEKTENDSFQ